jgi:hypothetical protein
MKFAVLVSEAGVLCVHKAAHRYEDSFGVEYFEDDKFFTPISEILNYQGDYRECRMLIFPSLVAANLYLEKQKLKREYPYNPHGIKDAKAILIEDLEDV